MSAIPEVARAQRIEQCTVSGLTALGFVGPAHALLADGTGTTAVVLSVLLTGTQVFAVFSTISAIFVVRELNKGADLASFVVHIPIASCSVAGTLLVAATCIVHWKAACGIAVLAAVFMLVVHHGTVVAFGKRFVNWSAVLLTSIGKIVLAFGGSLVNLGATLLTCIGNAALAFGGRMMVVNRLLAPPAGASDLEMGVENGEGEPVV